MKRVFPAIFIFLSIISCTKEDLKTNQKEETVSPSEIQAIKKELEDLKTTVASLTSAGQEPGVSVEDFNALKTENENLKTQVELLTSGFFEVDGLRFDRNGDLISVPKLERESVEEVGTYSGSPITLTTTRTYDAEGRVIEIYRNYSTYSEWAGLPFRWQKVFFEYSGKTCKKTTQTNKLNMGAGVPYIEEIVETTYW